jgi:hypothetical protein
MSDFATSEGADEKRHRRTVMNLATAVGIRQGVAVATDDVTSDLDPKVIIATARSSENPNGKARRARIVK